ncbi:hypothetical protein BD560DRAFT_125962 [Blakeslea trispora]|nr:hypothetical protein BD560DRAFT_125962 [Blakeslea trispora]
MSSTNADKLIDTVTAESRHYYNVHMRAIIPRSLAVSILGKKGLSIQYLQNYHHVQIRLSEIKTTQRWGRLIHIWGQSSKMADVWKSCLELEENPQYGRALIVSSRRFICHHHPKNKHTNRHQK